MDKEKYAIEKLIAHYAETLNAARTDEIPAFYTKDSLFMPDGIKTFSRHDLEKKESSFFKKTSFHIDYSISDIVVDSQFAFAQTLTKAITTNLSTNEQRTKTTRDFFVFRKDKEQWKIYRYIFNNVQKNNGVETNKELKMIEENNKQTMNHFVEFINTASEVLAGELISPDAVFYVPGRPDPLRGPAGYLAIVHMMRSGFPDIQWKLDDLVAENDKVAARFTMQGTHQGTFFGVPPTGNSISVKAMNFYRFSDGQIIEEFGQPDLLGLLQQIGAMPTN